MSSALFASPATPDADAIEKLAIEAVALTRQQQTSAADQRLTQAETICHASDFATCGNVLAARGIFVAKLGHFDAGAAEPFFMRCPSPAAIDDSWLEATTTLNLGFIAMQVNHYDEAVDWSNSAYQEATRLGIRKHCGRGCRQSRVGRIFSWAMTREHLNSSIAAENDAARLGSVRNQLKWLSDAGYIYRDSGDWARAAQAYRQALGLAQTDQQQRRYCERAPGSCPGFSPQRQSR